MKLVDWWVTAPERIGSKVPSAMKAVLVPWTVIGIAIALIPDLQQMDATLRVILGLPLALGIIWMALGTFLLIADKLVSLALFFRRTVG